MDPNRVDILVVGGGIIGASVARGLASRTAGRIAVVDLDLAGLYASSELNAGGARATWWQPVNIETCRETLAYFAAHRETFGFEPRGYLWLYEDPVLFERAKRMRALQTRLGLETEVLEGREVPERFPLLDRDTAAILGATFSPNDGLLNPNAVRARYRSEAEALGVSFLNRHYVSGVVTNRVAGSAPTQRRVEAVDIVEVARGSPTDDDGWVREALVTHRVPEPARLCETRLHCDVIVNCLGAWSTIFAAKIGVADVTQPVRRQICLVDVRSSDLATGVALRDLGMIVDASGLYYHPEGEYVLAGYSIPEEPPGFDFDYDEQFFETQIWPRLAHHVSSFERCAEVRGWSGLYAVTPDCSGIAGRVDGFSNLFEAHSFTGRGVMQSYAIGREMAALIDTGRFESIDLAPLSRTRFADPSRWVTEELHI